MITEIKNLNELKEFLNTLSDHDLQQPIMLEHGEVQPNVKIRQAVIADESWYANMEDYDDSGNLKTLQEVHGDTVSLDTYRVITPKGMIYFTD